MFRTGVSSCGVCSVGRFPELTTQSEHRFFGHKNSSVGLRVDDSTPGDRSETYDTDRYTTECQHVICSENRLTFYRFYPVLL